METKIEYGTLIIASHRDKTDDAFIELVDNESNPYNGEEAFIGIVMGSKDGKTFIDTFTVAGIHNIEVDMHDFEYEIHERKHACGLFLNLYGHDIETQEEKESLVFAINQYISAL